MAVSKKSLEIDEILTQIGEFGKFQILIEAAICISVMPTAMAVLLPYFTQYNPAWQCVATSDICTLNGTFTSSSKSYQDRCSMPRSEWEFTEPKDYSIVTQVREISLFYITKIVYCRESIFSQTFLLVLAFQAGSCRFMLNKFIYSFLQTINRDKKPLMDT